jgi:NAD(P)-dependent dehydrogenase (short-subunit alcohol dehydrogenase family)
MAAKDAQSQNRVKGRLAGKVAVVTGGSKGIGHAVAQAFVAEGCTVIVTGRNEKALAAAVKPMASDSGEGVVVPQVCDVREPYSVDALFAMVQTRFHKLDILVNNAGISQAPTPIENTSVELWREMIDTDLTSVFLCTRAALPLMSSGGTIVNNISAAARKIFPNFAPYTAAKSGAYGFTKALREELIPRGIRVTALLPGATSTDIWQQIMPDAPRGGMVKVDSVAQAVLYAVLLPPEANLTEISIDPMSGGI